MTVRVLRGEPSLPSIRLTFTVLPKSTLGCRFPASRGFGASASPKPHSSTPSTALIVSCDAPDDGAAISASYWTKHLSAAN